MWIEISKDFIGAFFLVSLLAWFLWDTISTISYVPFYMIYQSFPLMDSTDVRRYLKLLGILLSVSFGLLVHGGWDWLSIHLLEPLNPPLDIIRIIIKWLR